MLALLSALNVVLAASDENVWGNEVISWGSFGDQIKCLKSEGLVLCRHTQQMPTTRQALCPGAGGNSLKMVRIPVWNSHPIGRE